VIDVDDAARSEAASSTETVDGSAEVPPGEGLPPPSPPAATSDAPAGAPILGGVALDLATRLGVDPVWPRLAFVVLALFDGFGVLVYLGLWLVLIVGRRPGWAAVRVVGAAVLFGAIFLLDDVDGPSIESPWWFAAVLAGIAVALWAPRGIPAPAGPVVERHRTLADDRAGADAVAISGLRPPAREPSVLGRTTLGVAVVVAAAGALIDQVNGGRLHPEQWLGAAAAVCGAGRLVGAWRGNGRWLIVPGLLFAGAGFVAGHAARAGVDSLSLGGEDVLIQPATTGGVSSTRLAGEPRLAIIGAPRNTQRADLRVGIGGIEIDVDDEVTVEIHPTVHDGDVRVDGTVRDEEAFTVGPEGAPDVIVDAEVSLGDIDVERRDFDVVLDRGVPVTPELPELSELPVEPAFDLGEGLQMAPDGTVVLPDGAGVIGPNGELWSPYEAVPRSDGVRVLTTEYGDYLLLPNDTIITPTGILVDVPGQRRELLGPPTTVRGGD
jgi:phage shock protein PspC (stress-responsive transcriptional regulator)